MGAFFGCDPRRHLLSCRDGDEMKSICRDCLTPDARKLERCGACGSRRVVAHDELDTLTIAHLDCDAFYASV